MDRGDSAQLYTGGIDIVIPSQRMIPATLLQSKVKNRNLNRIHYLMANIELSNYKSRNPWALLLDRDGFISEGTGSDFCLVRKGCIYTPEPRNILRGISRDYVIELAGTWAYPWSSGTWSRAISTWRTGRSSAVCPSVSRRPRASAEATLGMAKLVRSIRA